MIGIDTNILVRYITRDDPAQWRIAHAIITRRLTREQPGWISAVVLIETIWVLRRTYRYPAEAVLGAVRLLLNASTLAVEAEREVNDALSDAQRLNVDFADALIAALAHRAGCAVTLTFDTRAARIPGFQLAT